LEDFIMRCIKISPLISALIIFALIVLLGGVPAAQGAVTYGFNAITNNNVVDVGIAESQLFVEVYDRSGFAVFKFSNIGGDDSSIADIYFDDELGLLGGFAGAGPTSPDPGVAFSIGASPDNLPAGMSIAPQFIADFSLDSDPPAQPNGVNPGEILFVPFTYGGEITSVQRAINADLLRIGIHVQGFASEGSESLITGNPNIVPEPCSILLSMLGMGVVGALKRRKAL
jgi:hypothetical protein